MNPYDHDPEAPLTVTVLGPVRAWVGGREIDLGPARQRALFAVLAAEPGSVLGPGELIEAVWGASPPPHARGSVYTYVSSLRRRLEPDRTRPPAAHLLTSGPRGYGLRLSPRHLDLGRFRRLHADAVDLISAGDTGTAAALLDEALRLWHGEAYAGMSAPFLELERHRLATLRLTAAEQRARLLLDRDDDSLIADLTALVGDHPLHEPLHELLMRALHRAGRHTDALEAFQQARRLLDTELGVAPGRHLRDLHRRVLAVSATAAPAAAARPAPSVGRDDELAHLRGLVRAVATGTGGAVWIDGEPGIGKTALLTAGLSEAAGHGCRVARATADRDGRESSLTVLHRALGMAVTTVQEDGPAAERVLECVRAACASGPLILVVDDMQWADETTMLVWERLLTTTARVPLLLVAAADPGPGRLERLRRQVRMHGARPLTLGPLSPGDAERLVSARLGTPIGDHLRAAVARAGGNPLYLHETIDALLRRNAVRTIRGVADIDAREVPETPEPLLDAARCTVRLLSPETRDTLRQAALLGPEFGVDEVVAATGRTPLELSDVLTEALEARIVVDVGAALAFRHPFLRQVLIETAG